MERSIVISIMLILSFSETFAQGKFNRFHKNQMYEANKLFDMEDYYFAHELYRELHPVDTNNTELNAKIGICLYNMYNRRGEARKFLESAVKNDYTEAFFYLALIKHRNEDFDGALNLINNYKEKSDRRKSVNEIEHYTNWMENAIRSYANPIALEIKNLGSNVNSEFQDYAPIIDNRKNILYFTSRRQVNEGDGKDLSGQFYENIYSIQMPFTGHANLLEKPVNSGNNDAAVSLSTAGDIMLIYRTNRQLTGGDLYITEVINGKWSEPSKLSDKINSNHQEASAAYSNDENILYFSSNRPEGFGGRDIYRVKKLPNGEWSLPQNLGPLVNTPYNEDAPFINSFGELFFSSEGHSSIGGYDIFRTEKTDFGWSAPVNLGYPINTSRDDIYYSISSDGSTAYFSSDRKGGLGAQDIFIVELSVNPTVVVKGIITTESEEIPKSAKITVLNSDRNLIEGVYTANSSTGRFIMALKANCDYTITIESTGYKPSIENRIYKVIDGEMIAELNDVFNLAEKEE